MIYSGANKEYLQLKNIHNNNCYAQLNFVENTLSFLWFEENNNIVNIDNIEYIFNKNQIVTLTEFNQINIASVCKAKVLLFNKSFYCIVHNDSEVGCKGILFYGTAKLPILQIPDSEIEKFNVIWKMLEIELESKDDLQLEMLQSMLKRFVIMCTRIYKLQENYSIIEGENLDIVREYNYLIEQHFKTKHTVADYANLLNKSPKTLSNLFLKLALKNPLHYIQERKILEARRLLRYSQQSIKEIAYELGYEDLQTFGRFFKTKEGCSFF